jgi:hypothetical protein
MTIVPSPLNSLYPKPQLSRTRARDSREQSSATAIRFGVAEGAAASVHDSANASVTLAGTKQQPASSPDSVITRRTASPCSLHLARGSGLRRNSLRLCFWEHDWMDATTMGGRHDQSATFPVHIPYFLFLTPSHRSVNKNSRSNTRIRPS